METDIRSQGDVGSKCIRLMGFVWYGSKSRAGVEIGDQPADKRSASERLVYERYELVRIHSVID